MNKGTGVAWEDWIKELVLIHRIWGMDESAIASIDTEAFRQNYDENQSPAEAMCEQLASG